jgi:hypothetical protein
MLHKIDIETQRQLLASIVEFSDDAIISKDLNGIVTSWNNGAHRIFGYSAEEMIGKPISVLAATDRADEMPNILQEIKRGKRIEHYETVRRTKDERLIMISLTVSPLHDVEGRVVGASKIARDITERKMAEEELARQADLLARSNADLQQFAFVTSHDLQEPLRTISGMSELIKRRAAGKLDEQENELLDYVIRAADRMETLIRDLLTYSKTVNPEGRPRVQAKAAVEWACNNLQQSIAEGAASIQVDDLPLVNLDMISLVQIFQNLLSNALKYRGAEPPKIRISAAPQNAEWVFSVVDNGIGIAPRHHERIFGLFTRLHGDRYSGTGVGLALTKKLVERYDGRIWVESELGKGATFKFSLPRELHHD